MVLGYWDGKPSLGRSETYERAADVVSQFVTGFRIERWYPDGVLWTSAGTIAFTHGMQSNDVRCPIKAHHRCPLVDRRGVNFGDCSLWVLALDAWLDTDKPSESTKQPICHRDYGIARLLAYLAAATMRGYGDGPGWYAGFPVVAFQYEAERALWAPRVERWNKLIDDPWHRIRLLDLDVIIGAIASFRFREELDTAKEQANVH